MANKKRPEMKATTPENRRMLKKRKMSKLMPEWMKDQAADRAIEIEETIEGRRDQEARLDREDGRKNQGLGKATQGIRPAKIR